MEAFLSPLTSGPFQASHVWLPEGTPHPTIPHYIPFLNWFGLREKWQENPIFHGKIYGFLLSQPTEFLVVSPNLIFFWGVQLNRSTIPTRQAASQRRPPGQWREHTTCMSRSNLDHAGSSLMVYLIYFGTGEVHRDICIYIYILIHVCWWCWSIHGKFMGSSRRL